MFVLVAVGTLAGLTGCGVAEQAAEDAVGDVQARAEREATCAQWRVVEELVARRDDPQVASLVDEALAQLEAQVPADVQQLFADAAGEGRRLAEAAGEQARVVADGADPAVVDEATRVADEAQATFDEAVAGIEEYCAGTIAQG